MQKYNVAKIPDEEVIWETRTFAIEGMTCDNCVKTIERIMRGMNGVKNFEISRADARMNITFDTTKTDVPAIYSALQKGGYKARAFADGDASPNS
jgi:copper chaperone CopZ